MKNQYCLTQSTHVDTEQMSQKGFMNYIKLLLKEGFLKWIMHAFVVMIFDPDRKFTSIKLNGRLIGGFFITKIPFPKYKIGNRSQIEIQNKINDLIKGGYKYFGSFIIERQFRNQGIGTHIFDECIKQVQTKVWLTSLSESRSFFQKNASLYCNISVEDIYIFPEC